MPVFLLQQGTVYSLGTVCNSTGLRIHYRRLPVDEDLRALSVKGVNTCCRMNEHIRLLGCLGFQAGIDTLPMTKRFQVLQFRVNFYSFQHKNRFILNFYHFVKLA